MTTSHKVSILAVAVVIAVTTRPIQGSDAPLEDNQCVTCHGTRELWEQDTLHLFVSADHLAGDVHWQKGIRCQDCHGGNPKTFELREAHAIEGGFRKIESPADMPAFCGRCHSDPQYMGRFGPVGPTDQVERFWSSVHGRHLKEIGAADSATCTSCHPAHQMRPTTDPLSATSVHRLPETCGACHREQLVELRKGVHAKAGEKDERGAGTLLDCGKCHGSDVHGMAPVKDPDSPVFLDHQVRVCGSCHEKHVQTYDLSVHGRGLKESGLLVTAVCADCHGAHGIYYAADRRSTLHPAKVEVTCEQCHVFLKERLEESVHGRLGLGLSAERPAPGGLRQRRPSCTDCHVGHDSYAPGSAAFRQRVPERCGNCHSDLSERYRLSLHGELTQLGYQPAAECADCHGAHDILPVHNSQSRLAAGNRVGTCRHCHPYAAASFTDFDPHANYKDPQRYPLLHGVYVWTKSVLNFFVGLFVVHSLLWFLRSFLSAQRHGRHRVLASEQLAILRSTPLQRGLYCLLLASFLGLALTGLPLKYSGYAWAQQLAAKLGGFETTSVWHHFCASAMLCGCLAHVVFAGGRAVRYRRGRSGWRSILFGPDSLLFNSRDARELLGMARWFLGLGNKPTFERWTYWEKFDYWAVGLGVTVIGATGLMLWFPNFSSWLLPGQMLNLSKMIHAELALVAGGSLFVIHVFNTHLRPEKFPLDLSVFTGLVSEEHLQKARPEYLERLHREGRLEAIRTVAPSRRRLRLIVSVGLAILFVGLALVAAMLFANLAK